jgi:hypothetical protein
MIDAQLPQPIADYFRAGNAYKTDLVVLAFWEGALVTDENQEHRGVAAIREWSDEVNENTSGRKHQSSSMPKDFLQEFVRADKDV